MEHVDSYKSRAVEVADRSYNLWILYIEVIKYRSNKNKDRSGKTKVK